MSNTEEDKLKAILSQENLELAWAAVKRNDGAAGVDGKSIEATDAHLKRYWADIRDKLERGEYRPAAVRAVQIPKANGGVRMLGIPVGGSGLARTHFSMETKGVQLTCLT